MFLYCEERIFIDKATFKSQSESDSSQEQEQECNYYFKNSHITEYNIFPNYYELDSIEFVSYVLTQDLVDVDTILDDKKKIQFSPHNIFDYFGAGSSRFRTLCHLYSDLRKEGWIIRRGINFGADFLLYESHPDLSHSKYAVYLNDDKDSDGCSDNWSRLLGMNRICVNAKKTMLVAIQNHSNENEFKYIQLNRWVPESNRE